MQDRCNRKKCFTPACLQVAGTLNVIVVERSKKVRYIASLNNLLLY